MTKKLASVLLAAFLALNVAGNVHAADATVSDAPAKETPSPAGDPHADVSKITNTLSASRTRGIIRGDVITWNAQTVFDNVAVGLIPILPYRSNFVLKINNTHFPTQPRITARTMPSSCMTTQFVAVGNTWEFRCGPKWFLQGDTWSLAFSTTAGGDHLGDQWTNELGQDVGSIGNVAQVVTGGR